MKLIPLSLTQKIGRQILTMKKDSPKILFVAGVVGVVGSTVLACRATLKLDGKLVDFQNEVAEQKRLQTLVPSKSYNRDMAYTYIKGSASIIRLYAPAIILGSASLGALTSSHVTLTRRNASLTAAYSAVAASYDAYRDRVREEVGEEKELNLYHAVSLVEGDAASKSDPIFLADPNHWSPYAKFFDEGSPNWQKNAELNRLFIQCQQNYLNHLLHARGHVFLNEAYDQLGIDRTTAGQVVGWVLNQGGDNYIDFGLFEETSKKLVNGWERSVILDFNVDGVIYDKI
jgi:hypothetical protein